MEIPENLPTLALVSALVSCLLYLAELLLRARYPRAAATLAALRSVLHDVPALLGRAGRAWNGEPPGRPPGAPPPAPRSPPDAPTGLLRLVLVLLVVLGLGCTRADWARACDVLRAARGLAPLVCELAGGSPADCARLRAVTEASEEAERAVHELTKACEAGDRSPRCREAIRGVLREAGELGAKLQP